jgi:DNA relaxase NicK
MANKLKIIKPFKYSKGRSITYLKTKDNKLVRIEVEFRNGDGDKNISILSDIGWKYLVGMFDITTSLDGVSYISTDSEKRAKCILINQQFIELLELLNIISLNRLL